MKTLLVIDANSIINRAFYGVAPLTSPSGLPTNAVYGLVNSVASQLETLKPDAVVAAFDLKAPTFRHKIYDAYKAGRRPTPPELLEQFPLARRALAAMGAFVAEKEGYEADDILGTFSREAEERGDTHTYLLTGDRDSLQLVSERTTVLLAGNRETAAIDPAEFFSRYGVTPDRFVDVKALMGDSSDNIPGVPGIGEKTALRLIAAYGDLDTLYASLDTADLPEKQKEKLRAGRESAELSRTLARIERNAPLGFGLAEAEAAERDDAALAALFNELGFARLTERFALKAAKLSDAAPEDARPVTAEELLSLARGASVVFTFTAEGDLSLLIGKDAYTLPASELCAADGLFAGGYALVCHDLKAACARLGRPVSGCVFDTMLAAYLDDPGATDYSLSALTAKYPPEKGASPVRYIASLRERLAPRLAESGADKLLTGTEIPVAVLLYEMERDGALVDREGLRDFGGRLTEIAAGLEQQIYLLAGREFNINSPKQLGAVLFEELGLKAPKKTKSGYSTASDVLEKLAPHSEIVSLVLEYRHVTKLNSTFVVGLLEAADGEGRVHTSFHQCGTATGRLSSSDPNLQNIPIRTELGRQMRRFFIAPEGMLLVDADYSQIELRLLAHLSGDENMIRAFREGEDIHRSTAAAVFGVPEEMVSPEMRKSAKAVNFGIVYGIGAHSLSEDLGISRREAAEYIESYYARYPEIRRYLDRTVGEAREKGYTTTLFGRRRKIPELSSSHHNLRAFGERVAMNSPIQGSAADLIKMAMVAVARRLKEKVPGARIILQIHDELICEAPEKDAAQVARILSEEMERVVTLSVPLPAETGIGHNWLECH